MIFFMILSYESRLNMKMYVLLSNKFMFAADQKAFCFKHYSIGERFYLTESSWYESIKKLYKAMFKYE